MRYAANIMVSYGITGSVATGKSTVAQLFGDLGASVISADLIAHELMAPGTPLTESVCREFEQCCSKGSDGAWQIDRRSLAYHVFGNPEERLRLDSLTHPAIVQTITSRLAILRDDGVPVAVVEIPLLFEANLRDLVDYVIVASCQPATQFERLDARGLEYAQSQRRVSAQLPLVAKEALADHVITTDGTINEIKNQVQAIMSQIATDAGGE